MSQRGSDADRARQSSQDRAAGRSVPAGGAEIRPSLDSAVGPDFRQPHTPHSSSLNTLPPPGYQPRPSSERDAPSFHQEAWPHTSAPARRRQDRRDNTGQPHFHQNPPRGFSTNATRESHLPHIHHQSTAQYTAPPPGFQQLGHAPQILNPQARPYQPGHLTWQQQQQQQQHYREARPPRRRQAAVGSQPQQWQHQHDQNNARRANASNRGNRRPAQQGRRKAIIDLPGKPAADDAASGSEEKPEYPSCSICYEDCKVVSVQPCNHKEICATCTIRMRRFYQQNQCSMCRTPAPEVILSSWRPGGVPDWQDLSKDLSSLWINPTWEKGVYVDNESAKGLGIKNGSLSNDLQARTGRMCKICDPEATKLFPSYRSLIRHLEMEHQKQLCELCMEMEQKFCSELELFDDKALAEHMEVHPKCRFCQAAMYSKNEELIHMGECHFVCRVCLLGGRGTYFNNPESYSDHLRSRHYTCTHADCLDSFVAFATPQEVHLHMQELHGSNRSRRRHGTLMPLMPPSNRLPTGPRARDERGTRVAQHAARVQEMVHSLHRLQRNVSSSLAESISLGEEFLQDRQNEAEPFAASLQDALQDAQGRLQALRGDDVGEAADLYPTLHSVHNILTGAADQAEQLRTTNGEASNASAFPSLHSLIIDTATELRRLQNHIEGAGEAFPDLAAANQLEPPPEQLPQRSRPQQQRPRLVSVTRRCPCGRLRDHPVIEEDSDPGTLPCNDACQRARRREQLASAFDIPDPSRHTPVMERTRIVEHSPETLLYAHRNMAWVKNVEQVMIAFVESPERQHNLPAMPKAQREAAHQMAEAFGLITQSYGQEPDRHIRLIKGGRQFVARNLLSAEVAGKSLDEITQAMSQSRGHSLYLTDVAPRTDIEQLFGRWRGEFRVEQSRDDRAIVTFNTVEQLKEAMTAFGGGLRGTFRVDRQQTLGDLATSSCITSSASGVPQDARSVERQ